MNKITIIYTDRESKEQSIEIVTTEVIKIQFWERGTITDVFVMGFRTLLNSLKQKLKS